ncbi:DUF3099 domain-containing protein [Agrococcus sp. ARC_14]|uniref:DUF3099 domain-containing protein n=1 Tax=Agrococcus sp. ARC_14 TaxID=2919927 RepID=UPI001F05D8C5|nr:DUF3099 domain-containing protein [Agrococcus sp. ARC_14]MCH1883169.1 DUF3099 domain-containing protein [Agrococcus sp. ARC_14]
MREPSGSITDLPMSPDEERQRRFRMYFYLMLVRVASLLIFFVVPDWWKLIPAFFAVFIPYFAVVIANVSQHHEPAAMEVPNALPPGASATPEPEEQR